MVHGTLDSRRYSTLYGTYGALNGTQYTVPNTFLWRIFLNPLVYYHINSLPACCSVFIKFPDIYLVIYSHKHDSLRVLRDMTQTQMEAP